MIIIDFKGGIIAVDDAGEILVEVPESKAPKGLKGCELHGRGVTDGGFIRSNINGSTYGKYFKMYHNTLKLSCPMDNVAEKPKEFLIRLNEMNTKGIKLIFENDKEAVFSALVKLSYDMVSFHINNKEISGFTELIAEHLQNEDFICYGKIYYDKMDGEVFETEKFGYLLNQSAINPAQVKNINVETKWKETLETFVRGKK